MLLIHGVGMCAEYWSNIESLLATDFSLTVIDLPGHGQSPGFEETDPPLCRYTDSIAELCDVIGQPVIVVGHSMGALIALDMAVRYADRVAGIAVLNGVYRRSIESLHAIRARVAELSSQQEVTDPTATLQRWFGKSPSGINALAAETCRGWLGSVDQAGYRDAYQAFANADAPTDEQLQNINCPALFMTGAQEPNSTAAMSQSMSRLAPDATCIVVEGARHMMSMTHGAQLATALTERFGSPAAQHVMKAFDIQTLRRAFGSFMTGVTVVTARAGNGDLVGFTANSFTSVSIEPPLLLVCPGNHLSSYDVFNRVTHFSVSILAEGQELVSNTFASVSDGRFDQISWRADDNGCPLIAGATATFSCRVHQRHIAGDHMLLIGQVLQLDARDLPGLGYCSRGYFSLSKEQQSDASSGSDLTGVAGAIVEYDARVLVIKDNGHYCLPTVQQSDSDGARSALQQYFEDHGLNITLGPVYSIYDDPSQQQRFTFFRARANSVDCQSLGSFETIESLDTLHFRDQPQTSMMARFASESRINTYGLYVGNAESGDLHLPADEQE